MDARRTKSDADQEYRQRMDQNDLVVSAEGRAQATLRDAEGETGGASVLGLMTRLEGAALAPEAVARRLDAPARSRIIGRARGFTVLISDPPEQARRYRVELKL